MTAVTVGDAASVGVLVAMVVAVGVGDELEPLAARTCNVLVELTPLVSPFAVTE